MHVEERERIPSRSWLRRWWPWLVGLAILGVISTRIPVDEFRNAIRHGPHLWLAIATLGVTLMVLCTDSISTWIGLVALGVRRPLSRVFLVRGATYALFVVNYGLGQGAFGFYLNRTGIPALRAVGVTLFLIGTNLATLLVVTTIAWTGHPDTGHTGLWWTLLAGSAAFIVYLGLIAASPTILSERQLFAPLFDAGLRGHAVAIVGRLPHTAVIVLGHWMAVRVWGIEVPWTAAVTLMPAVVIASVLPISPAGLGTTQAALVYFFSVYAPGSSADQRSASVLSFAIVYFVYGVIASVLVGFACTPFAKKLGLLAPQVQSDARG